MAHFYCNSGFFVIQLFCYRLSIVNRNKNPDVSDYVGMNNKPKTFRFYKYEFKLERI